MALATKFNPRFDVVIVPGLSVLELDPGSDPPGITDKIIIDATTPIAPEKHGHYSQMLTDPVDTAKWITKLQALLARQASGVRSPGSVV